MLFDWNRNWKNGKIAPKISFYSPVLIRWLIWLLEGRTDGLLAIFMRKLIYHNTTKESNLHLYQKIFLLLRLLLFLSSPELRLFVKGRGHKSVASATRVHVSNRVGMALQSFHNGRAGNIPNANCGFVLTVSVQVLAILWPSQLGLAIAIILVSIQIPNLISRPPVHDDVPGRVRRQCQIVVLEDWHVHNCKGYVVIETSVPGSSVEIDFLLGKIVLEVETDEIGRPPGIGTECIFLETQGLDGSRELQLLHFFEGGSSGIYKVPFQFVNLDRAVRRGCGKNIVCRRPGDALDIFSMLDAPNLLRLNGVGKAIRFQIYYVDRAVHASRRHKLWRPSVPRKIDGNHWGIALHSSCCRFSVFGIPKGQRKLLICSTGCQHRIINREGTAQDIRNTMAVLQELWFAFGIVAVSRFDKMVPL